MTRISPTPTGPWRTIVVDDEPLARQTLRLLLAREEDFAIVAECGHGAEGIDAIRRERPDVLFLDVQMPEVDGFEVLRRLEPGALPAVIFVTAFDRYALQAFEHHALDYLLKPFSDELRVHRSAIANVAGIRAIEPVASGEQRLTLEDGTVLKVSRTHRADVVDAIGTSLRGESS